MGSANIMSLSSPFNSIIISKIKKIKTIDDDSKILYNVYLKYKVCFIIDTESKKSNYKLFISNQDNEIHTLWEIKQCNLHLNRLAGSR